MRKPNLLPHTHTCRTKIRHREIQGRSAMTDALTFLPHENLKPNLHGVHGRSAAADAQKHASTKKPNSDQRGISGFCMFLLFLAYSFGPQQPNEKARKRQHAKTKPAAAHTHTCRTKTKHREIQGGSVMTDALTYSPHENSKPNLHGIHGRSAAMDAHTYTDTLFFFRPKKDGFILAASAYR